MGLGETKSCAEKRKKAEGALRYTLIGAFELAKSSREVREGGSHKGKKEGARSNRQEPGKIFKVIFKVFLRGIFFEICYEGLLGV